MMVLILMVGIFQSWNIALSIFNLCLISAVMTMGANIQWGYAGLINFGIMGYTALGGLAAVLISVDPVQEAWRAGGFDILMSLWLIVVMVLVIRFILKRFEKSKIRTYSIAAIIISGILLIRFSAEPGIEAIEAVDPAKTGFLGGFGLPIIFSWIVGALFAGGLAFIVGKVALGLRADYLAIATLLISEIVIALIIFLFFLFLRGIFSKFVIKRLENYVSKTSNNFDNTLVKSMEGPAKFFPIVLGFFVATSYLTIETQAADFLETINRSLITILIFWTFHQIIGPFSTVVKSVSDLLSRDLVNWIIKALKVLIIILGLAAVLELWGIKIGPIIAGLGLFGVAVALGAQDLFKNLISGILVLVEKRFKVGDWIYVEDVIEGTVESIGFRSTVVRRFDKSLATIPNFQFAEKAVINNSLITNRRINWIIGLEYRTTSKQLIDIKQQIENYIKNSELFSKSENTMLSVKIDQFAASSIDIKLICFTKTTKYLEWMKVKDLLALEIKNIVEKNNASFAFPSTSVYVEKN